MQYDPVRDIAWRSNFGWGNSITDEGDNVLRLEYGSRPSLTVGQTYQFRSGSRDQVGTFIHKSKNVHFENMGFHYMHGLGIVGQRTENLSFNKLDCTPRPETGRTCASSADFIQISGCKGLISITNSEFRGAHDDVFNIHGTHLQITDAMPESNQIKVTFRETRSWGFEVFEQGDEIEFINSNSMLPYGKNRVKAVERLDDTNILLTLEEALPSDIRVGADVVENATWTPDVLVKGNKAYAIPTRGILCTTRGNVRIEDNLFYKTQMSGVLLEDDGRGWYESGYITDMTIKNNTFVECGGPVIYSNPQTNVLDPEKTVHSNITITGNTFKGNSQIRAISTKNLVVEGNIFEDGGNVSLTACNGYEIADNNQGLGSVSADNSVGDRSLTSLKLEKEEAQVTTLDRTGMKVTEAVNERNGYSRDNILDGDKGTFWHSDWDNPLEQYSITVDLNGEKRFNRVAYLPRQNEANGRITEYELYVKKPGSSEFEKIAEGNWAASVEEQYINFDTVTATEIKLTATDGVKDSSNRFIASIAELNFQMAEESAEQLQIGQKQRLQMKVLGKTGMPAQLPEDAVTYESSDETVAVVSDDGTVTAVGQGEAEITVTVRAYGKELSDSILIQVGEETYLSIESIDIKWEPAEGGVQLQADIQPEGAGADLMWEAETCSGAPALITQDGFLSIAGNGRAKVTAYSKNDPEVSDSVMLVAAEEKEADGTWNIINENKANWQVIEDGKLELVTESGAIWSGTTNTVKNVITIDAGAENFELVTKMAYQPGANYAEAGIIFCEDLDNYVMLTRKKHSGYNSNGNIYSMITEQGGNAQESPADHVVIDDVADDTVYLKLKKEGNSYSGYYSADGQAWKPVWENRTLEFSEIPRVGVIGYNGGTAVYDYLEINGTKITFEKMNPSVKYMEAEVTEIFQTEIQIVSGTQGREPYLPDAVGVVWNGQYQDLVDVDWDTEGYDADKVGTYTLKGSTDSADLEAACIIHVVANKEKLEKVIAQANRKLEAAYEAETWKEFQTVLAEAEAVLETEDMTLPQETVDECAGKLTEAMDGLKVKADLDGLNTLITEAEKLTSEQDPEKVYDNETLEEDRLNGYYSKEALTELEKMISEYQQLAEKLQEIEDMMKDEASEEPEGEPGTPVEEPEESETPAEEPGIPAEKPEAPAEEPEAPAEDPEEPMEEPEISVDELEPAKTAQLQKKEVIIVKTAAQILDNKDSIFTEDEKAQCAEACDRLLAGIEKLENSKVSVSTKALETQIAEAESWMKSVGSENYQKETWANLKAKIQEGKALISSGIYSNRMVENKIAEITAFRDALKRYYSVSVNANDGGSVTSDAVNGKVLQGESVEFHIYAEDGYLIDKLIVNGSEVPVDQKETKYVVENVNSDVRLTVFFEKEMSNSEQGGDSHSNTSGGSTNGGNSSAPAPLPPTEQPSPIVVVKEDTVYKTDTEEETAIDKTEQEISEGTGEEQADAAQEQKETTESDEDNLSLDDQELEALSEKDNEQQSVLYWLILLLVLAAAGILIIGIVRRHKKTEE